MSLLQTFKVRFIDEQGLEVFMLYRNYVGTESGLHSLVMDEIIRGDHCTRVVDAIVSQTSGICHSGTYMEGGTHG